MGEVLTEAVMPMNLVFTVMLGLVVIYWIMVILGALDVDFLDIDFDSDVDVDIDADADVDFEGGGPLQGLLEFFYVGEIPVMVLFSVLVLSLWTISVLANHYLNPVGSMLVALPIAAGNIFVSCILVKIIGVPLSKFFKSFDTDANASRPVIGRICKIVTTEISGDRLGQGEMSGKGAPILINVKVEAGQVFKKGDEAVVLSKDPETGVYLIGPVDL